MDSMNAKSLYQLINRSIVQVGKRSDEPVNKEMYLFKERYTYYISCNPQQYLFEERRPLMEEVAFALDFCDALDAYRQTIDANTKEPSPLSDQDCRILLKGIEIYKDHISSENYDTLEVIKNSAKRRLPEFREQYLLREYYNDALFVINEKKKYQKAKKNKQTPSKDYEKYAVHFYERITHDEEIKHIKICSEKKELYILTLEIVDCLPKEKYSRSTKFKIKSQLWWGIAKSLSILDKTKVEEIKKARIEAQRYAKAAENALGYTNFKMATSIYNRRKEHEWLYL